MVKHSPLAVFFFIDIKKFKNNEKKFHRTYLFKKATKFVKLRKKMILIKYFIND